MCGIAGVKRMGAGASAIGAERISQLLLGIQHRGPDATGICLQYGDGSLRVHKSDDIAWRFMELRSTQEWLTKNLTDDVVTAVLHTRAATLGSPRKMQNNHPLWCGRSAITHNGSIANHEYLFKNFKLKRNGEVDSDIIRAILDEYGLTEDGVKQLNQMSGGAAIAAVSSDYPGMLLLARSRNPLVIAADLEEKLLYWASEKDTIHAAARPFERIWRTWFKSNHSGILFN